MVSADDLKKGVNDILYTKWDIRTSTSIPETDGVKLSGGAAKLDATVLYADVVESSRLASNYDKRTTAKILKSFIDCTCRLIKAANGAVTSFDGDRVMGVFIGDSRNSNAARCALHINYTVKKILRTIVKNYFESIKSTGFNIDHGVGVDTSDIIAVRGGVRGSNDLIWIGRAPNFAAKLSEIREQTYKSFISEAVFNRLNENSKYGGENNKVMWERRAFEWLGKKEIVYRSSWRWMP